MNKREQFEKFYAKIEDDPIANHGFASITMDIMFTGWLAREAEIALLNEAINEDRIYAKELEADKEKLIKALRKLINVTKHLKPCQGTMNDVENLLKKMKAREVKP